MYITDALQIVLDLARQNVLEDSREPDEQDEQKRQLEAISMVEDMAVKQFGEAWTDN